jgi:hypothetical protein
MAIPSKEQQDKYGCVGDKILFICDECSLLFCGRPTLAKKHLCLACKIGGLK